MFFGKRFSGYRSSDLSGLDILVLSIIKNNDGISGYEIIQKINQKFGSLWKASAGTIYPLLSRLIEKAFVSVEEVLESNRQKKFYRITEKGNEVLGNILKENLELNINTLGDYIKTVYDAAKATIPNEEFFDHIFSCFTLRTHAPEEEVNELDYSMENIYRIENIIADLKRNKNTLERRQQIIDDRINYFTSILEKIKTERTKNAKTIEIFDDDKEFENI